MGKSKRTLCVGAALAVMVQPAIAAAQAAGAPQTASDEESEAIVVTANKREQNINDVGLTITALSSDAIASRKITSLADVAAAVPGLAYSPSTTNTPIFTLRGVGFNESSLGVYPAVSVYADEVPMPFPVTASHAAYDLARIEVLKGPQGTLFGQNSTGGAINYIVAKPTDTFEAGGDIGYGRFNTVEGNAYISGPLSSTLGARLAVTGLNSDDWQRSNSRPTDTNGKQSYVAGRLILEFKPSDALRFSLNLNAWRDKSDPQAQQLVAVRPQVPAIATAVNLAGLAAAQFSPLDARAADWSTGVGEPRGDRKFYQASLRMDADVTSGVTLTTLTSYNDYKQTQATDGDGLPLVLFDLIKNDGFIKSFNQEVRLANSGKSAFRWVVGANYEDSHTFENQDLSYADSTNNAPAQFNINRSAVTNDQRIRNYALFANAEYAITSQLTFKAGARYTSSRNNAAICGYSPGDGNVAAFFNLLGSLNLGGLDPAPTFTPIDGTGCYTLNAKFVPGEVFRKTLKEDNVSWRAGLDFKASDDILLYANVSRGYKAGSFPSLAAANFTALKPVTQESVTAYEGGFKAELADRKVQLNGAVFYYDYKDKQIRGKLLDPIFGILDVLQNVPKSRIFGLEGDVTVRPVEGLTLSASATYLESKIKTYTSVNVLGLTNDFGAFGDALPFTPKLSYGINADYKIETAGGGKPFIGFTVAGRSSSDAAPGGSRIVYPAAPLTRVLPGLTNVYKLPSYTTVDARIGYEAANGQWRVMVWAKNLLNEYYLTNVIASSDTTARFAGRPATYGVTIGFKVM